MSDGSNNINSADINLVTSLSVTTPAFVTNGPVSTIPLPSSSTLNASATQLASSTSPATNFSINSPLAASNVIPALISSLTSSSSVQNAVVNGLNEFNTLNQGIYRNSDGTSVQTNANNLYTQIGYAIFSVYNNFYSLPSGNILDAINQAFSSSFSAAGTSNPINLSNVFTQGLMQDYAAITGNQIDPSGNVISGDLAVFNSSTSQINITPAFENALNSYMQTFSLGQYSHSFIGPLMANNGQGAYTILNNFITGFQNYVAGTTTSLVSDPTDAYYNPNSAAPNPFTSMSSFQAYYQANNTLTSEDFTTFIQRFYTSEVSKKGFFDPASPSVIADFQAAVNFNNQKEVILQKYHALQQTVSGLIGGSSTISGTNSQAVTIINRILLLLIEFINTVQNIGIAQANKLTFLTQFQNAYTAMLQQIPTFLADGQGTLGVPQGNGSGTQAQSARDQLNSSFNSILGDNLRSLRDVESNAAKTEQSDVNATNDSTNQITGLITALLQQLGQLVGVIFR